MVELQPLRLGPGDKFIRRVRFADHIKRGIVHWKAFKEKDEVLTLSFTFQNEELLADSAITAYQQYFSRMIGGDLPGLLRLWFEGLATILAPPLPPRYEPDPEDEAYGHLHCCTDKPRDKKHMEQLAKLINDGDLGEVLRVAVRKPAA